MNAFLGVFFIFLSIIVVKEIRQKKRYWISLTVACIILLGLGIDKINRDNKKDELNKKQRERDSTSLQRVSGQLDTVNTRFSDFKKQLDTAFHIKDSANTPVQIHNYMPVFKTHINKARDVKIG